MPEDELIARGVKALVNALGPVDAMRVTNLRRLRRLESVQRHHHWQTSVEPQQFLDQVFDLPEYKREATHP